MTQLMIALKENGLERTFPFLRQIINWKTVALTALLIVASGLAALAVLSTQHDAANLGIQITRWVNSLQFPGRDPVLSFANTLTNAHPAILTWVIGVAFFILRGRPLEAIAVLAIPGIWVAGELISRITGNTYPSGHTTHAVTFYGLLAFLTLKNTQKTYLKIAVPTFSIIIIGLTSIGRIYDGAHLPVDIAGSYLLGFIGVTTIALAYNSVKEDRFHLPSLHKEEPAKASDDGIITTGSIASTVYLDPKAGTAIKEYNPPLPVRLLHRLAFQAAFPYQNRREALEAAAAKRKIAGLLTRHRFGQDMVAGVYEIRENEGNYQFVTELIYGNEPACNKEIETMLNDMFRFFQETGLPTWQIDPANPHAYSNFIRDRQGTLKLIDLESALISFPAWKQLLPLIRDGYFPAFDDVDFTQLRSYMRNNSRELNDSLGIGGFHELEKAVEDAEDYTKAWKGSELRILGRIGRWTYRHLDVTRLTRKISRRMEGAEAMAKAYMTNAIDRWEREGLIDSERAVVLQSAVSPDDIKDVTKHMGAHIILTVAIVVPIPGLRSLARCAWTTSFRLKAMCNRALGRISGEEYKAARSTHSVPVMLISLVPGLGAVAYAASGTMMRDDLGRMLLDQSMYKLPFGLYRRLKLAKISAPRPVQPAAIRLAQDGRDSEARTVMTFASESVIVK